MMLSAYKGAEDGTGQIIRMYNTTSESVEFSLKIKYKIRSAWLCDLCEREKQNLKVSRGGKIVIKALPKQIVTVKLCEI